MVPAKRAPALSQAANSTPRRCRPGLPSAAPHLLLQLPAQQRQPGMGRSRDDVAEGGRVRHRHRLCRMADAQTIPALESAAPVGVFDQRRDQRQRALAGLAGTHAERALAAAAQRCQSGAPPRCGAERTSDPVKQAPRSAAGRRGSRRQMRGAVRPRPGRPRRAPAPAPGRRRCAPARRGRGTAATHPISCRPFSDALASQPSHSARASAISAQTGQEGRARRRRRIRRTGSGISVQPESGNGAGGPGRRRRAENQADDCIGGVLGLERGCNAEMTCEDVPDAALVEVFEEGRQMPHANQRRGAVAARTARPDQQREKKALAAFDFPLMGTGRARIRYGEHRNRPASAVPASRETRQAVFDQAEIDQRDCRALPDLPQSGQAWNAQNPPLSAMERMTSRSK